jgi:hypothetical protein
MITIFIRKISTTSVDKIYFRKQNANKSELNDEILLQNVDTV